MPRYVDYSAPDNMMHYTLTNVYGTDTDGYVLRDNIPLNDEASCEDNDVNISPYILFSEGAEPLYTNTVCLDALHYDDVQHQEIHNKYGLLQSQIMTTFSQEISKRNRFIASDSTFLGSNKYSSKLYKVKNALDLGKVITMISLMDN